MRVWDFGAERFEIIGAHSGRVLGLGGNVGLGSGNTVEREAFLES